MKDSEGPTGLTLTYNPNALSKYGSFKKALFGHLSHAIISKSTAVCIKQCWYLDKASGSRLVYDKYTQIAKLSAEINCLRWASALMGIVYTFINKHVETHGAPPFEIPSMRFVKNALLIGDAKAYMVEEVIDEETDGIFVKYIGNGSVIPLDFLTGPAAYRAKFLAFAQHVQYLKTKGLAFIGDFQGGPSLLTDPQIITAPYVFTLSAFLILLNLNNIVILASFFPREIFHQRTPTFLLNTSAIIFACFSNFRHPPRNNSPLLASLIHPTVSHHWQNSCQRNFLYSARQPLLDVIKFVSTSRLFPKLPFR